MFVNFLSPPPRNTCTCLAFFYMLFLKGECINKLAYMTLIGRLHRIIRGQQITDNRSLAEIIIQNSIDHVISRISYNLQFIIQLIMKKTTRVFMPYLYVYPMFLNKWPNICSKIIINNKLFKSI